MNDGRVIPQSDEERKAAPMYRGVLGYFPGALFQVAAHSMRSDRKHNADKPEEGAPRWNRGKSTDHDDCIIRHTAEQHSNPLYHKTARAWRALADLQEYLEREMGYDSGAHSYRWEDHEPPAPPPETLEEQVNAAFEAEPPPDGWALVETHTDEEGDVYCLFERENEVGFERLETYAYAHIDVENNLATIRKYLR